METELYEFMVDKSSHLGLELAREKFFLYYYNTPKRDELLNYHIGHCGYSGSGERCLEETMDPDINFQVKGTSLCLRVKEIRDEGTRLT